MKPPQQPSVAQPYYIHLRIRLKYQVVIDDLRGVDISPEECFSYHEDDESVVLYFGKHTEKNSDEITKNFVSVAGQFRFPIGERKYNAFKEAFDNGVSISTRHSNGKIAEFLKKEYDKCVAATSTFFEQVRWRFKFNGGSNRITALHSEYSMDGKNWLFFNQLNIEGMIINWSPFINLTRDEFGTEVKQLVESKVEEPLYHKILRNAKDILVSSPETSLIECFIALEVACKTLIAEKENSDDIFEGQSPDLLKLFEERVPTLVPEFLISSYFSDTIKRISLERNIRAHRGEFKLTRSKIEERIQFVENVLHLIDFFLGNSWAIHHVRSERPLLNDEGNEALKPMITESKIKLAGDVAISSLFIYKVS